VFYRAFRAAMSVVLRLFFRLEPPVDPSGALGLDGPVIFVGNHPNGLIDPALCLVLVQRPVTFLAKAPLFTLPVLGAILRGLDALPVFRKQDAGGDTSKNEGTLGASVDALVKGRAITLFPEGKSHSEPQLAELKTGCARIALEAVRQGAKVRVVPVGFTYEAKNRFKSRVHVEVGAPLEAAGFLEAAGEDGFEAAKRLTASIAGALQAVTLNLEAWEDLPIVETAEALYALARREEVGDAERKKAFARGMKLLRAEQPERFEVVKADLASFRRRLGLFKAEELQFRFHPVTVAWFVVRNLLWLAGLPVFALGMGLFTLPYLVPSWLAAASKVSHDVESTVKLLASMVIAPLWWAGLVGAAFWWLGPGAAVATSVLVPVLALLTRWYFERRARALRDVRAFLVLGSGSTLKAQLLAEGQVLTEELNRLDAEFGERVRARTA
jgi:glycerol-3-phosphate O-acyltransferase/dihydroxyacetone phosphate acyltransferase